MILKSLPDVKAVHKDLTVGKDYDIIYTIGDGVVIQTDAGLRIVLLASRFGEVSL